MPRTDKVTKKSAKPELTTEVLEAAFASIGEGAIIIDECGRIIRVNDIALKLLGYKESELIGQLLTNKIKLLNVDLKTITPINGPMVKAIISGRPVYEYLYYQAKNKARIPVFVSTSSIVKDGQPIGGIEIIRDASMEETIDQMKSEFISLASHQLRTPLSSIKTYTHMLLDGYMGNIDEENRLALEVIISAANRMNELISTLLNITRLESGAIVINENLVDINQIARQVIEEMDIPAKSRSVRLTLSAKSNEPTKIQSDGPLIKEVITNLVSNSVKYSKEGGQVKLSILNNPNYVTLVVKDNGLGIPEGSRSQIFTKFFRASNVVQVETNGTGLGLYMVRGLVDELGGSITFTSSESKGTTFKVKLPRKRLPYKDSK